MTIAADIGRATIAGIEARNASARLKIDAGGLQIDRLSVADLGGGAFSASGRIDTGGRAPRGALALDFETRQTAAIAALVTKFAPKATSPATGLLDRVSHTKLHATLEFADAKVDGATVAQLAVTGDFDAMRLDARARMTGDWANPSAADVRVDGTIDAPDGATLIKLLGLDRIVAAGKGPGQFKLLVTGPADGELTLDTRLTGEGLLAQSSLRGRMSIEQGVAMSGSLQVPSADLRPLRPAGAAGTADRLPLNMASRVAIAGGRMTFDDIDAKLGASTVRGRLVVDGVSPRQLDGALEADAIDAAALIARAIGMPAPSARQQCGLGLVERAVRRRRARRVCRPGCAQGAAPRRAAAADGAGIPRDAAPRQGRIHVRRHVRRCRRWTSRRPDVVPCRRERDDSACQDLTHRCRRRHLAPRRRAAAGHRIARPFGRSGRDRLEPGRADRFVAGVRKNRARRCPICRPRSARLRCRDPRGRPGIGDRRRAHLRRGEQGIGERPACRSNAPKARSPSAPDRCG